MGQNINTPIAIGLASVFLTILGAFIFKKVRKERIPTEWDKVGTLKELYLFPLKSGKGIKTSKVFCTEKGIKEIEKVDKKIELKDRSFVIYTSKDKEVRSARQLPKTVLIETRATENGIILSAPNQNDINISIPKVKKDVTVIAVWGSRFGNEPFVCTDCGDYVAKWLSNYLLDKSEGLRLGYGDGSTVRNVLKVHKKWAEHYTNMDNNMSGIFSDLAALHLVNHASVDNINEKLDDDHKVTFLNFRPNLLIEGPAAFVEQKWEYIKIGEVIAKVCLECLRCIETTVSPNGVMNKEREPMKSLEKYQQSTGPFKFGVMGIYLKVVQTGKISSGDDVYVSKGV